VRKGRTVFEPCFLKRQGGGHWKTKKKKKGEGDCGGHWGAKAFELRRGDFCGESNLKTKFKGRKKRGRRDTGTNRAREGVHMEENR